MAWEQGLGSEVAASCPECIDQCLTHLIQDTTGFNFSPWSFFPVSEKCLRIKRNHKPPGFPILIKPQRHISQRQSYVACLTQQIMVARQKFLCWNDTQLVAADALNQLRTPGGNTTGLGWCKANGWDREQRWKTKRISWLALYLFEVLTLYWNVT